MAAREIVEQLAGSNRRRYINIKQRDPLTCKRFYYYLMVIFNLYRYASRPKRTYLHTSLPFRFGSTSELGSPPTMCGHRMTSKTNR